VCAQAVEQRFVVRASCGRLIEHDDVYATDIIPPLSERLADDALQAIAGRAQTTVLLANRQPEPGLVAAIRSIENCKHFVPAAFRFLENATISVLVDEPVYPPEAVVGRGAGCRFAFRSPEGPARRATA